MQLAKLFGCLCAKEDSCDTRWTISLLTQGTCYGKLCSFPSWGTQGFFSWVKPRKFLVISLSPSVGRLSQLAPFPHGGKCPGSGANPYTRVQSTWHRGSPRHNPDIDRKRKPDHHILMERELHATHWNWGFKAQHMNCEFILQSHSRSAGLSFPAHARLSSINNL